MKAKINPQFYTGEEGDKVGVKLKIREYERLIEDLEDAHDIYLANKRTSEKGKTIPFEVVMKKLFGDAKK